MDTALGFLGLVVFVACVVGLAAGITWLVVKAEAAVRRMRQRPMATPDA